jgi:hypothetical protein
LASLKAYEEKLAKSLVVPKRERGGQYLLAEL